jgi:hypothetical protein
VALLDHAPRQGPALHEADEEEEAVDPHLTVASEAKQARTASPDCLVASILAMTITSS